MLWLMRDWEIGNSQVQRIFLTLWIICILSPNLDLQRSINCLPSMCECAMLGWQFTTDTTTSWVLTRGRDCDWREVSGVRGGQAILLLSLQTQTGHWGQIIPVLLIAGIMTISNNIFLTATATVQTWPKCRVWLTLFFILIDKPESKVGVPKVWGEPYPT